MTHRLVGISAHGFFILARECLWNISIGRRQAGLQTLTVNARSRATLPQYRWASSLGTKAEAMR